MQASEDLVVQNMKLVYFLISKHYPTYSQDEDVIQAGMEGLCKAAKRWNPDKGIFQTYAGVVIRREVADYIRSLLDKGKSDVTLVSIDQKVGNDEESASIGDLIGETDDWESVEEDFRRFASTLSPNKQRICEILLNGGSQTECARTLELSATRVCQLVGRIKRDWRKFYADKD